jgi:ubiquitin-protein ligase
MSKERTVCPQSVALISLPDGMDNPLRVRVTVIPECGPYRHGRFNFLISIPPRYPFMSPSVLCETPIWHPNVCMKSWRLHSALLQRDWMPVLSLDTVIHSIQLLLLEPDLDYCINLDCAKVMQENRELYLRRVQLIMQGGFFFECLKQFPNHYLNQSVSAPGKRLLKDFETNSLLPDPKRAKYSFEVINQMPMHNSAGDCRKAATKRNRMETSPDAGEPGFIGSISSGLSRIDLHNPPSTVIPSISTTSTTSSSSGDNNRDRKRRKTQFR